MSTSGSSQSPGAKVAGGLGNWADERLGIAKPAKTFMRKVFPDHWSFMLGEIAMYSLIILLLTGTFLTFWFVPSAGEVVYNGSYVPLKGVQMSEAFKSTVDISFDVRGGLIIRQIHHWAALIFVAAITVHMFRVFFTGAFRKPRELNWVIGVVLLLLSMLEGFAGYSIPDDLLSGTGLRIASGFMESIPVIGSYLTFFLFDGPFPGSAIIPRLYTIHVLLLPAIIVGLFTAHILMVTLQKHTQYPGPGRTNDNVVGYPFMPVYLAKAGGFFFIVFGVTSLLAAVATINPIWAYGPYDPSPVTAGAQPDWYMGFTEGALRLMPGFPEFHIWGFTLSLNVFIPGVILLGALFTVAGAYPFIEAWVTKDKSEHHILDRPRNAPTRTALGAMAITFYLVLFLAGGNDLIATHFHLSINDITNTFQALLILAPPVAFWVTKRVCLGLQRRDRDLILHGRETGRIVRLPHGEFIEVHEPLEEHVAWTLVAQEPRPALELPPLEDENGVRRKGSAKDRVWAKVSRFYFDDRIEPVTPAELAAAHDHGHGPAEVTAGDSTDAPQAIKSH